MIGPDHDTPWPMSGAANATFLKTQGITQSEIHSAALADQRQFDMVATIRAFCAQGRSLTDRLVEHKHIERDDEIFRALGRLETELGRLIT